MIIKSLSRKTPSFAQLLAYLLEPKGARCRLWRNLPIRTQTPAAIIQAFEENHALLPRRANGNALFHEIIALSPDTDIPREQQITTLQALAERYLSRRAPEQLAVGVIHTETAHLHLHLMISSNAVLSRKRVWLPKAAFAAIQRELETYRLAHFPELGDTRYYTETREGLKHRTREQAARNRTGQPSRKEELAAVLTDILQNARNQEMLNTALAEQGLTLYQRGRAVGVRTRGGRRHRFSTLGLGGVYTEAAARIELAESRLMRLQQGRAGRTPEREWER